MLDVHKIILAAKSPLFVEIMMKNPEQCVITNVDMDTLKLLVNNHDAFKTLSYHQSY